MLGSVQNKCGLARPHSELLHPSSAGFCSRGRRVTSGSAGSPPRSCSWLCASLPTRPPAPVPPRVATSPFASALGWLALGGAAALAGRSSDRLEPGPPRGRAEPHLSLRGKPRPALRRAWPQAQEPGDLSLSKPRRPGSAGRHPLPGALRPNSWESSWPDRTCRRQPRPCARDLILNSPARTRGPPCAAPRAGDEQLPGNPMNSPERA